MHRPFYNAFIMNVYEVQSLSHFEDLSSNRYSVKELILWHLFSTDTTLWPKANCVKSNFSKRYPLIERRLEASLSFLPNICMEVLVTYQPLPQCAAGNAPSGQVAIHGVFN